MKSSPVVLLFGEEEKVLLIDLVVEKVPLLAKGKEEVFPRRRKNRSVVNLIVNVCCAKKIIRLPNVTIGKILVMIKISCGKWLVNRRNPFAFGVWNQDTWKENARVRKT